MSISSSWNIDWDLVALIFMITMMIGLYLWNRFGKSKQHRQIAFGVFLTITMAFTIFMQFGGRPGGIYIVA